MKTETSIKPVKLSIVIPCFNEEKTLEKCILRVLAISDDNLSLEIIVVDDCSTDNSIAILEKMEKTHPEIVFCRHEKNQGKGAALQTGFRYAKGDIIAIQDADLEYNQQDLKSLIVPIVEDEADVVFGSRFLKLLPTMFSDLNFSDMETGCCPNRFGSKSFDQFVDQKCTFTHGLFAERTEPIGDIMKFVPEFRFVPLFEHRQVRFKRLNI